MDPLGSQNRDSRLREHNPTENGYVWGTWGQLPPNLLSEGLVIHPEDILSNSRGDTGLITFYINIMKSYLIQYAVCLTTGPKPLPKRFLHIVRSKASSFKWEYPLLSLRSSSSFLRLLPRLLVTSISPFIFPSITCFRRQFLRKMWPIQLAFRFRISRRIFLCSLTRSNTSSFLTWSIQLIFSILLQHHISKLFQVFLICCPKRPSFSTIQSHAPNVTLRKNYWW